MLLEGCDMQITFCSTWNFQTLQKEPEATITLGKVRNFQCEQNRLESLAIDSESLVRQVLETLYLQRVCHEFTSVSL